MGHTNTTGEDELKTVGEALFGDLFRGVYAADELTVPRMLLKNQCCIVNLDERESSGSHWIALAQDGGDLLVYDSFGRSIAIANGDVIHTENDPEQKMTEMNCGQRCLAWLCVYHRFGGDAALLV
jgi:hypothetical protein